MRTVLMSEASLESLIEHRRRTGSGRLDECWQGVWHLTDPTRRHQEIAARLYRILSEVMEDAGRASAFISINVTDREEDWIHNHRCPDGALILLDNPGRWIGEGDVAFLGGPDLIVEVLSQGDDTHDKIPFHESLGVKEFLVVDQRTGRPELWSRVEDRLLATTGDVRSGVTGLVFAQGAEGRLVVRDQDSGRQWEV